METPVKKPWKAYGRYGSLGIELILSMAIGYYAGRWMDGRFGTHWIAIVGFVVGVYAGFRQIFRAAKRMTADAEREEREERDRWRGRGGDGGDGGDDRSDGDASQGGKMAIPRDLRGPLLSVAATGVALTAAMGFLGTGRSAWSTAVGALVALANLYVLGRVVGATVGKDGGPTEKVWRVLGAAKMLILFGVVWFLLTSHTVDPIPFVVGLGALPIGLVTGTLVHRPGFVDGDRAKDPQPDPEKPPETPED